MEWWRKPRTGRRNGSPLMPGTAMSAFRCIFFRRRTSLTELTWLDCGMFAVLLAGAWTLYAEFGARRLLAGERGTRFARRLFGLALIPTGLSHFAYVSLTVPLIPAWIPFPYAWAYVTGACHIAAGLGV